MHSMKIWLEKFSCQQGRQYGNVSFLTWDLVRKKTNEQTKWNVVPWNVVNIDSIFYMFQFLWFLYILSSLRNSNLLD